VGDEWSEPHVFPRYDGQSLLNVPASICGLLGGPSDGLAPTLDEVVLPPALLAGVRAVALLVIDGLGRWQLDQAIEQDQAPTFAGLAARAVGGDPTVSLSTITSVFPSSTMPALATLSSGFPPVRHGLIGWTVYLEEFGEVAEIARWGPAAGEGSYQDKALGGHNPTAFFGQETLYQRLKRGDIRSAVVSRSSFRGTGFTEMVHRGADYQGFLATSSLLPMIERALQGRADGERLYIYGYWDTVDQLTHHRGPLGFEPGEEIAVLDFVLGRWLQRHQRRGDLLLLLTADHGHVATSPGGLVRLDHDKALVELLRAPASGERRLAYLHARPGCEAALRAHCEQHLASVAQIVDPQTALDQGWLGPPPVSAAAHRRAGDLILVARGDSQLIYPLSDRVNARLYLGNHGALAPGEMLVPLLAVRL
jgi:hypothetical protein